jgi:hypothetical protein
MEKNKYQTIMSSIIKPQMTTNQLQQLKNAISFLEDNASDSLRNVSAKDFDSVTQENYIKNNYEHKEFNGEKVDDFRKQGEYGAKKFIKP